MTSKQSAQKVIGMYLVMKKENTLKPINYIFLVPDCVLSFIDESTETEHHLMKLHYGRPMAEAQYFIEQLVYSFPLLLLKHKVYASKDSNAFHFMKGLFNAKKETNLSQWHMHEACSEFSSVDTCLSFMMAQV